MRFARGHQWLVLAGISATVLVLGLSALAASPAHAGILGLQSPGQALVGVLGPLGQAVGGTAASLAVRAFTAIIHALFAPIAHFINTQLLGWLVAVPDYASPGSHVAAIEHTVLAMAGAALGAVATISIARYWAAGLAGNGASALEGLAGTVGAALLLPLWPWIFHTAVALANEASTGLLGSGSVTKESANLLALGLGAGVGLGVAGLGLFVSIVMAVVASVLFLGLLLMKVALAISTVLVFVGMPIAIVLSPVMAWIPRVLARAFLVCLSVPLVWAVCFAASGALLDDGLFLQGSPGFFNALLEPLVAIALLWLLLLLPTRLAQMAMLGAGAISGGFMSRAVSYAAGSQLRDVARQHMPGWAGGQASTAQSPKETDSRLGTRLRAETALSASKATGAAAATAATGVAAVGAASMARRGGTNGGASGAANGSVERQAGWLGRVRGSGNPRAYSPPPLAGSAGGLSAESGLQRPSWRQEDFDAEILEAGLREQHQPVSGEQATQAREMLSPTTQKAVGQLVADHGPRARQHLAYQALGEWAPQERQAIRTLAAATPEVRAQAFGDTGGSAAGFGESSEPKAGKPSPTPSGGTAVTPRPTTMNEREPNGGTRLTASTRPRPPQDQPPTTPPGVRG